MYAQPDPKKVAWQRRMQRREEERRAQEEICWSKLHLTGQRRYELVSGGRRRKVPSVRRVFA